ncbi:MAG: TorF family putative porin, partial [Woeseiaceae bacterium]|nr:TorF family putative porin [Woeseiaceae bacterium]
MNTLTKTAAVAVLLASSAPASAEFSANVGFMSDYYFRGVFQKSSSAYGGLDFEKNGFYAGTWAADVGDGLEVDGYFGYGGEIGDFGYGVGFTGYYYTGDFDDTYEELNLSASYAFVTVTYSTGQYQNFSDPRADYDHYSIGFEHNGFYGTYAAFGQDFTGEYVELGYGTTVAEIDLGVSLVINDKDL